MKTSEVAVPLCLHNKNLNLKVRFPSQNVQFAFTSAYLEGPFPPPILTNLALINIDSSLYSREHKYQISSQKYVGTSTSMANYDLIDFVIKIDSYYTIHILSYISRNINSMFPTGQVGGNSPFIYLVIVFPKLKPDIQQASKRKQVVGTTHFISQMESPGLILHISNDFFTTHSSPDY